MKRNLSGTSESGFETEGGGGQQGGRMVVWLSSSASHLSGTHLCPLLSSVVVVPPTLIVSPEKPLRVIDDTAHRLLGSLQLNGTLRLHIRAQRADGTHTRP